MRTPSRGLALVRVLAGLAILLLAGIPLASGQDDARPVDRHLFKEMDPSLLRDVRYNFNERFTYSLKPDSSRYGTMEHFDKLFPEAYWDSVFSNLTMEDGSLAWGVSRDMMGVVALYDATGDARFLRLLKRYGDAAMAARDDQTGKTDADGRSEPAWSTARYGIGERRIYLVHSGLIVEPILEWAVRADKNPGWSEDDEKHRQRLIDLCEETIQFHDYQIDLAPGLGEAVYESGREDRGLSLIHI